MNCRYKTVLFDFDGTFADTGRGVFAGVAYAVEKLGFEPLTQSVLRTFIGPPLTDSFMAHLSLDESQAAHAIDIFKEYYSSEGVYKFDVYEGIIPLIKDLKACGVKVAIASTKPEVFIRNILDSLEFTDCFDFISAPVSEERVEKSDLMLAALAATDSSRESAVMVGDRRFDIEGAIAAGLESIGVTYGYGSEEELKKSGATHIAGSADEIRNLLF
ncbi:MAG: HAD hydrolase-like protein [Clostridia bacterium]|nr:HAD hydrolase-like protein [Clostridia bacterium]